MCQINIDKYLLARYKQGGRTLPDVDCYGLVLEFFKNELKINLPLEQSITDISQAPEGEKNLNRDKIYLCGFYTKNNFLAHCGIVIDRKILHINKNGAVLQSIGTIKRIYSLWSLKFYEITYNSRT